MWNLFEIYLLQKDKRFDMVVNIYILTINVLICNWICNKFGMYYDTCFDYTLNNIISFFLTGKFIIPILCFIASCILTYHIVNIILRLVTIFLTTLFRKMFDDEFYWLMARYPYQFYSGSRLFPFKGRNYDMLKDLVTDMDSNRDSRYVKIVELMNCFFTSTSFVFIVYDLDRYLPSWLLFIFYAYSIFYWLNVMAIYGMQMRIENYKKMLLNTKTLD